MMKTYLVIQEPKRGNREMYVTYVHVVEAESASAAARSVEHLSKEFKKPYAVPAVVGVSYRL